MQTHFKYFKRMKGKKKPCWNPPDPSSKISISNDDVKGDNPKSLKSYLSWPWHVFSLHVLQFRPFFYPLHSKPGWMSSFGCLSDFCQFFANSSISSNLTKASRFGLISLLIGLKRVIFFLTYENQSIVIYIFAFKYGTKR